MTIVDRICSFQSDEPFDTPQRHIFAFALDNLVIRRRFLDIIVSRHRDVSNRIRVPPPNVNDITDSGTGIRDLSASEMAEHTRREQLACEIRLGIESFYLFSKILIDEVARLLEFYFGPARSLSLDSHDQLVKNFIKYCRVASLQDGDAVVDAAQPLKADICDFRDAHSSTRRLRWRSHQTIGY